MITQIFKSLISAALFIPMASFAFTYTGGGDAFAGVSGWFESILFIVQDVLIPLVFSLALLVFFWGVVKYIRSEGQGKAEGRNIMIWGIVALFVMASVWGLVYFIRNELNIGPATSATVPTIDVQ